MAKEENLDLKPVTVKTFLQVRVTNQNQLVQTE